MAGYYQRSLPVERTPGGFPTITSSYVAANIAPHGTTTRWSYTVASGKAAVLEYVMTVWYRDNAAATASLIFAHVLHSAGHSICRNDGFDATLFQGHIQHISDPGYLAPGESVSGVTQDSSAGGTMRYFVQAAYRELVI